MRWSVYGLLFLVLALAFAGTYIFDVEFEAETLRFDFYGEPAE